MAMLGIMRFSADGKRVQLQYYSPYHDGTYHPSHPDMLALTLDITGEATEQVQYPEQEEHQPPEDPEPTPPPTEPMEPTRNPTGLIVGVAVGALIVIGGATAFILTKKKKK